MEVKNINYPQKDKAKQLVMELDQRREDWKTKKKELKFIAVELTSEWTVVNTSNQNLKLWCNKILEWIYNKIVNHRVLAPLVIG